MKLTRINRGKMMLSVAWIGSFVFSAPQAMIFHVETHPNITHYTQCVTYHAFRTQWQEILYAFSGMILLYAMPLVIVVYCYASIYFELYQKSRQCETGELLRPESALRADHSFRMHFQIDFDARVTTCSDGLSGERSA